MRFIAITVSAAVIILFSFSGKQVDSAWIRINLLGYKPSYVKVAVWCSKENKAVKTFQIIDAVTKKIAFNGSAGKP